MQQNKTEVIKRIDVGLTEFCKSGIPSNSTHYFNFGNNEYLELHSLLSDLINRYAPPNSTYKANFLVIFKNRKLNDLEQLWRDVYSLYGLLLALRTAYSNDLLQSVEELIHGDIFEDFLEMAEYLLEEKYKDPAAMLIGGVLEEHLRKLCQKHDIAIVKDDKTPKKASSLNEDLARVEIYTKGDQKSIIAWLDIRNNAAHGKFEQYQIENVDLMLHGVRNFILKYPA